MQTIPPESQRFKTLLAFGKFFSFIGWLVVGIGVIMFLLGLSQLQPRSPFTGPTSQLDPTGVLASVLPVGPIGLLAGLLVTVYGLMLVASGQGISCFVSLENNTHATMAAQQAILTIMRARAEPSPLPTHVHATAGNTNVVASEAKPGT